ncbi:hypothetical protein D1AOALGA4SA_13177 [Olavius algarvensis Delta 1 endosymbiont]|nr:hypothetical protein D1AOALGA4SA_13177 [Olavius algarvensis Delta 1 endosymbiont]
MINTPQPKQTTCTAIALAALIWLTAAVVISGCGKKGPPEPPSGNKPPRVRDLAYSVTGQTVKLSWSIPTTTEKARKAVAGFLIYQFQQPAYERECPNCPVIFKEVGDVPARSAGSGQPDAALLVFTQEIEPGYRYIYKVKSYDAGGIPGKDSNFVEFIF